LKAKGKFSARVAPAAAPLYGRLPHEHAETRHDRSESRQLLAAAECMRRHRRAATIAIAFQRQMNRGWSMSNIITGRQLRAARILAGLTQRQLAQAVGVHERAARYWELKENKPPTSTTSILEEIEAVLRNHGVIVFASPTPGARLVT
jgi:DNA-binding XRE family transcriptional regulator